MEEFHNKIQEDAHSRFQSWRRGHLKGYFLTEKTKFRYNLHHVSCPHIGDDKWQPADYGQSLTSHRKVCSTDATELRRWARVNAIAVTACKHCIPSKARGV